MALKPCRECGARVSTREEICPHCGVHSPTADNPIAKISSNSVETRISNAIRRALGIMLVVVFLGAIFLNWLLPKEDNGVQTASSADNPKHSSEVMTTTSRDIRWPDWMSSFQQCMDRAKDISTKYGFAHPLGVGDWRSAQPNEINVVSIHYNMALTWTCSYAGERKVNINLASFRSEPPPISPRELIDKLAEEF